MLDLLHDGHPGITKMKLIARQTVWWPRMDAEVAEKVETCQQWSIGTEEPSSSTITCLEMA